MNIGFRRKMDDEDLPPRRKHKGFKFDMLFLLIIPTVFLTFLVLYFIVSFNDTLGLIPFKDAFVMAGEADVRAYGAIMAFGACVASIISIWFTLTISYRVFTAEDRTTALNEKIDNLVTSVDTFMKETRREEIEQEEIEPEPEEIEQEEIEQKPVVKPTVKPVVKPSVKPVVKPVSRQVMKQPSIEQEEQEEELEPEQVPEPIPITKKVMRSAPVQKPPQVAQKVPPQVQKPKLVEPQKIAKAAPITLPSDPRKRRESRIIKEE